MPSFYLFRLLCGWSAFCLLLVGTSHAWAQTSEGLVPDAVELSALRDFYTSTGGPTWARSTNWLQGTTVAEAATWYGVTVTNGDVTGLFSGHNNLQGIIPASLGQLTQLTDLELGNARGLTGPIPRELGQLTQLQSLIIVTTGVNGSIPPELGQLTRLVMLNLFNNELSGPIPAELGNLTQLQMFNLGNYYTTPLGQGNQFVGGIPATLGQLTRVSYFEISAAPVGGSIPPELGNLTNVAYLELSNCHLTGAVPAGLAQATKLTHLLLNDNHLTSLPTVPLPAAAGTMTLRTDNNEFTFASLEPYFTGPGQQAYGDFRFSPQRAPTGADTVTYEEGDALHLSRSMGGQHNRYQWEHRQAGEWEDVTGATGPELTRPTASLADTGLYRLRVTNDWVTGLTLYAKAVYAANCPRLRVSPDVTIPAGDAVILRAYPAQAGASVQWSPATGLSTTTGPAVTAAPATTTTYTVTATERAGGSRCPSVPRTVTVTVTSSLALDNPPVDDCQPTLVSAAPTPRPADVRDEVNYVRTYTARAAYTNPARLRQAGVDSVQVKTEYLDGLGRPVQTVLRQESPSRRDVVQPMAYDALGRQPRQYLPYAASAATADAVGYRPHALAEQYEFYRATPTGPGFATDNVARTGVPFTESMFEASPLNRVLAQGAPGEAWQLTATGGHAVRVLERPNTLDDQVLRFVSGYEVPRSSLTQVGPYAAGELWLVETANEQGIRTREFKDKQGQLVWKQTETARDQWLRTAYVYDDFGRPRAVLPPKAVAQLIAGTGQVGPDEELLIYRYRYDGRGWVSAKQVPGMDGETQFVYDQLDRPVLSQDPRQRARREWAFAKFDALGRPVLTGLVTRDVSQADAQAEADATNTQWEERTAGAAYGYSTDQAYPRLGEQGFAAGQVLTITHYDDYNFDNDPQGTADAAYDAQYDGQLAEAPRPDARVTGLPTRTRTRVLGVPEAAAGAWLTVTTFYDEQARPIQVRSTHARGGEDVVTTQLDFVGKVMKSYAVHTGPNHAPLAVAEDFAYDHAGRLTEARQQLPGEAQAVVVAQPAYNEVGQLVRKTLAPGTACQQRVDYAYNVRGWLTHLNDAQLSDPTDLWGMELRYDCGFAVPQYNGNIAGQTWRSQRDGVARAYGYRYDGASRLVQADFVARNALTGAWTAERQNYGLSHVRYDENGNILALRRHGLLAEGTRTAPQRYGVTDELTYRYRGNQLTRVDDAVSTNGLPRAAGYQGAPASLAGDFQEEGVRQADEYGYDANGNQTHDANKRITAIAYNHLNLPKRIVFGTGADSLVFRYTAGGQKVQKRVYETGQALVQTDYLGAYQYEGDSLRFFPHAEGRVLHTVQMDAAGQAQVRYEREYSLQDQQNNLRIAYRPGQRARPAWKREGQRVKVEIPNKYMAINRLLLYVKAYALN